MKKLLVTAVLSAFLCVAWMLPVQSSKADTLELDDGYLIGDFILDDLIDVATLAWTPEWTLFMPYTVQTGNWFTGLDIQSTESGANFNIYFFDGDDNYATNQNFTLTDGQWTGMIQDLMPSGETYVSGSLLVFESDYPFAVTKFTGSNSAPEGFGYQTFYAYSKNSTWPNNKYEYRWAQTLDSTDGDSANCDSTRFDCVMGGEAVLDNETGLVWLKDAGTIGSGAYELGNWLAVYNQTYANRGGWRLPTIDELTSLFDSDGGVPDSAPFTDLQSDYYWTSSYCKGCDPDTNVWIANPVTGGVTVQDSAETSNLNYFWLVRGGK